MSASSHQTAEVLISINRPLAKPSGSSDTEAEKRPLQGIAQILHQVEMIDGLDRLWRPVPNPLGVEATPIAADDLDTGMRLQPRRNGWDRAIGEQINHVMALEITDNGPKTSPSPPGPFIEPNHPWGRKGGNGCTMDEAQDRPDTPLAGPVRA